MSETNQSSTETANVLVENPLKHVLNDDGGPVEAAKRLKTEEALNSELNGVSAVIIDTTDKVNTDSQEQKQQEEPKIENTAEPAAIGETTTTITDTPSTLTTTETASAAPEVVAIANPSTPAPTPTPTPTPAATTQQIDYSQMTPAPQPPAEPDINNLPSNPIPKHQEQFALKVLKIIKRMKDAAPFLQPVDIVKLKIPFYYNFIPRPMDISTIEKKLNVHAYDDTLKFIDDFNLIVANCAKFNGADSVIAQMARNIQATFEKHMLNLPSRELPANAKVTQSGRRKQSTVNGGTELLNSEGVPTIRRDSTTTLNGRPKREIHPPKPKDMPYDIRPRKKKFVPELRFSQTLLKELASKKYETFNYPFLEPVDPVALNCPTYFDYIKEPMDFTTIQNKMNNNQYENGDEFEHDIRLVFKNCYTFNPEGTAVNMMGHRLEDIFDKKWIDRPQTPLTPQQSDEEYSSEEESDNEVIDETAITNPAIQYLEEQLERMKLELAKLKREELDKLRKARAASKKKTKKPKKRRRSSNIAITYDMKKDLSERINELPEKKLNQVLTIISESLNLNNQNGEEIELDIDQLDNATIMKLYHFVFKKKSSQSRRPNVISLNGNGKKAKKSKNLSEAEQSRQIENLKKKIELLDQSNVNSSAINELSDSDDDLSSESSEEE